MFQFNIYAIYMYIHCYCTCNDRGCPQGYSCHTDLGDNPNSGYSNFDNLGWAMIAVNQIFTLDNTDDLYDKVS